MCFGQIKIWGGKQDWKMPGGKIKQDPFSGLFRAFNMQMNTAKKKIEKLEFQKTPFVKILSFARKSFNSNISISFCIQKSLCVRTKHSLETSGVSEAFGKTIT